MQYTITSSTKKIPIYFGNKSSENLKKYIGTIEFDKLIVITDTNVQGLRGKQLKNILSPLRSQFFTINPGEKYKTFETYQKLCDDILQFGISKKSLIIAFGGGVVGNIAGFVASTLMRGIKFIHIPTTIIAQADSTTGGKQAINSQYGKNLIGTFYEPEFILIDPQYLTTLPKREIRCGIAECIKHALCQDNDLLEKLENENFDIDFLQDIIQKTITLKINTIEKDRKEYNLGKVLVYGHTIGHALETLLKGEMNHGESISIGMC
ncbi:MAG: 3-dehydroquinate synthase, partial [candidate division SR1 bacterium]